MSERARGGPPRRRPSSGDASAASSGEAKGQNEPRQAHRRAQAQRRGQAFRCAAPAGGGGLVTPRRAASGNRGRLALGSRRPWESWDSCDFPRPLLVSVHTASEAAESSREAPGPGGRRQAGARSASDPALATRPLRGGGHAP